MTGLHDSSATTQRRSGPLAGTRIVELAGIGPVPFAAMLLADMGAEILLVQPPHVREAQMPMPPDKDPLFRGRTRLTLDLKSPADRERLLDIVARADVLLEGYRPGVMERLGLGPAECHGRAPKLVYGRMTGWGQSGPLAHTAGHDPTYIAITGALYAMGYPDRPPLPPLNIVGDFAGGSLYLVIGVIAALLHARSTGQGQVVDAAIIDGTTSLMTMVYAMHSAGLWSEQRGANIMDGSCPFGSTYATSDGGYMAVCALEPSFYAEFVRKLGLNPPELPKQWDRSAWPAMRERFAAAFATRTRAEWTAVFDNSDACVAPVLSIAEAPSHPHNRARGVFVGDVPLPAPAPRFSATPSALAPQAPETAHDLLRRWQF
jgi:alpha-methylacyl-CoA racemase